MSDEKRIGHIRTTSKAPGRVRGHGGFGSYEAKTLCGASVTSDDAVFADAVRWLRKPERSRGEWCPTIELCPVCCAKVGV